MERFKTAFEKDLSEWQANINNVWHKKTSALDPRFKDLKYQNPQRSQRRIGATCCVLQTQVQMMKWGL